jgi:hypothetical protein
MQPKSGFNKSIKMLSYHICILLVVHHMLVKAVNFWTSRRIFYLIPPYIENKLINKMS